MTRAGLSRALVVETAARLADGDGLGTLTVSAVARALDVRPPSLYAHVDGAAGLRAAVSALALTELADRVDRALAGRSGRDALVALADEHRSYAREHPGRWAATAVVDPTIPALAEAAGRHAAHQEALLRGYAVPEDERVHAVRLVAGALRGFVDLEAGGALSGSQPPPAASWPVLLDRLDQVLRTWDPRPGEPT